MFHLLGVILVLGLVGFLFALGGLVEQIFDFHQEWASSSSAP